MLLRLLTHFEFSLPDDPEERKIEGWNRMLTKPFGGFLQRQPNMLVLTPKPDSSTRREIRIPKTSYQDHTSEAG